MPHECAGPISRKLAGGVERALSPRVWRRTQVLTVCGDRQNTRERSKYPSKRTGWPVAGAAGLCHFRTHAPQQVEPYSISSSARPSGGRQAGAVLNPLIDRQGLMRFFSLTRAHARVRLKKTKPRAREASMRLGYWSSRLRRPCTSLTPNTSAARFGWPSPASAHP
jgi:hypothetical protein